MDLQLQDKVALVVASSKGLGKAVAAQLSREGCNVMLTSRDAAQLEAARQELLGEARGKVACHPCDITRAADIENLAAATSEKLGPVDILVNNAADRARVPTLELSFEEWHRIVHIILDGAFLCSRAVLPHMIAQGWGRIVNISGSGNLVGYAERVHVHAGKGGLDAMTRSLSSEFCEKGITVNTVSVGLIGGERPASAGPHPRNVPDAPPIGFKGEPMDIANAVGFLCQPASRFITGQTLHVNGGEYLT
jgi:3-oxoacyl-[acyl-carrier protein] reductase